MNLGLRGATLLSKFLLVFFLARFLEPAELGLYGLLLASVGYAIYLVGFDFYTFSTREIIGAERTFWGGMLKDQVVLFFLMYALLLPLLLLVFVKGLMPWYLAPWFFLLLVLEHLGQELNRLLVAISEPLLASFVLFLRSGAWVFVVLPLLWLYPELRRLETVLAAWSVGVGLACCLGLIRVARLQLKGWLAPIDWLWVWKGVKIAAPFLLATLAVRGVLTVDRYWIQATSGMDVLGAYVLFMGIATAVISFLDAGVFVFIYPALIAAHRNGESDKFKMGMRQLTLQTILVGGVISLLAFVLLDPVLSWLGKPFYIEKVGFFNWIMLAMILYGLSMIPHYGLYATGADKHIILSNLAGLLVFAPSIYMLSYLNGELAVPYALCVSFALILFWKLCAYTMLHGKSCAKNVQVSSCSKSREGL